MTPWEIHGIELANCNCDYACPCQFNSLPTDGFCAAAAGFEIHRGRYGEVTLDGLRMAAMYRWPGPVHEGAGTMQLVIDERASEAQRQALIAIMSGEDTEPMSTMWSVYATMCPTRLEPLARPIEIEIDVAARRGRIKVPGCFETRGEPILNPVTGNEHRVRIDLPHGFEYAIAEIGRGWTRAEGAIDVNFADSYGQFAELHLSNSGVIREAA